MLSRIISITVAVILTFCIQHDGDEISGAYTLQPVIITCEMTAILIQLSTTSIPWLNVKTQCRKHVDATTSQSLINYQTQYLHGVPACM